MPKLKTTDHPLPKQEEEQITAGIARDSDNPEWTKADFSRAEAGRDFFSRLGIDFYSFKKSCKFRLRTHKTDI